MTDTRRVSWQLSSALSSQSRGPQRTKSLYNNLMDTSTCLGFSTSCKQVLQSNIMEKKGRTRGETAQAIRNDVLHSDYCGMRDSAGSDLW